MSDQEKDHDFFWMLVFMTVAAGLSVLAVFLSAPDHEARRAKMKAECVAAGGVVLPDPARRWRCALRGE